MSDDESTTFDGPRRDLRVAQRLEIEYAADCPPIRGFVEDLGEGGMYVDTDQPLPASQELEFSLRLPDADPDTPVTGTAVVVWSAPTGMGLQFTHIGTGEHERIRQFVAAVHFNQPPDLPSG